MENNVEDNKMMQQPIAKDAVQTKDELVKLLEQDFASGITSLCKFSW